MVKDAREFLLAIKMSTRTEYDSDAVEFLDNLREGLSKSLDAATGIIGHDRDSILFFEGMLRGVQIKLLGQAQAARTRLSQLGLLSPDGKPTTEM